MNCTSKIYFVVLCSILLICGSIAIVGCELLTGIGVGVGVSKTATFVEDNLRAKKIELTAEYEKAIVRMQNAADPNELRFETEKVQQIQIARAANLGALTIVQEFKGKSTAEKKEGYLNLLHGLIPIALGYAGIEMRKRLTSEKKRQADKQGRELALREIATMKDSDITAPVVKELIYRDIAKARAGTI